MRVARLGQQLVDSTLTGRVGESSFVKPMVTPHLTTDNGVRLHSEETGAGTLMVFVHELCVTHLPT